MHLYNSHTNTWHHHRETREYHRRKQLVKNFWIVMGLIMLTLPLGGQLALGMLTTFLGFAFLDEKPYAEKQLQSKDEHP